MINTYRTDDDCHSFHSGTNNHHDHDHSYTSDAETPLKRVHSKCYRIEDPNTQLSSRTERWMLAMLRSQFFGPCPRHEHLKKNECTYFCMDCPISSTSTSLCIHCLPEHQGHSLLQIRRYVYCDVVRAHDISPHMDVAGIQNYIINQAKVIFLRSRTSAKMTRMGAPDSCRTCHRSLREGCSFCSLGCKVDYLLSHNLKLAPSHHSPVSSCGEEVAHWREHPEDHHHDHHDHHDEDHLHVVVEAHTRKRSRMANGRPQPVFVHNAAIGSSKPAVSFDSEDTHASHRSSHSRRKQSRPHRSPLA